MPLPRPPPNICLFCRSLRIPLQRAPSHYRRGMTTLSTTSIKTSLPPAPAAVADGLSALARAGFAGEGRVRLALRGLAPPEGVSGVRVAVLGRSGSEGRLVAVLLADPLSTEPEEQRQQWMKEILTWSLNSRGGNGGPGSAGAGRALLIRYGPPTKITTPAGSPISLLSVPSPFLRSSALEILLAPLPPVPGPEDLTVVTLKATEIPGARVIEYPVHKTLLWAGEGSDGLSTLLNQRCSSSTGPVLKALSLPAAAFSSAAPQESDVKIVDLRIAEDAIAQLEKSTLYVSTFQREVLLSGIGEIAKWVADGAQSSPEGTIKPVVKDLAYSIISEAEATLRKEEDEIRTAQTALETRASAANTSAPKADTFGSLSRALKSWSQDAHAELQDGLDAAFETKPWKDLAWWKLIWATDDVSSNTREVLTAGFLTESRKKLLFLAGRFSGAGYHGDGKGTTPTHTPTSVEEELAVNLGRSEPNSTITASAGNSGRYMGGPEYSPPFITRAVGDIVRDLVPNLQSSANKLLLKSASLSASGVLVSAMLYALEISLYSSLSTTAVAVVYSAKQLQNGWEKERRQFQDAVKERGRVAVAETERWGWDRLREGVEVEEHGTIEEESLKRVNDGKKLIKSVRSALEKV